MPINKVNFSAGSEDLADIYISQLDITQKVEDGTFSQDNLSSEGVEGVFGKSLWGWGYSGGWETIGPAFWYNYRSSPVQIGSLTDWKQVHPDRAVKTNGTLWAWGPNYFGQLGLNDRAYRSSPVQVGTLTDWKEIFSVPNAWFLGIKTNGTLWACGRADGGRLGLNSIVNRSSPVQVGALTDWKELSSGGAGSFHNLAIKTNGTLWAWGATTNGSLGLNTPTVNTNRSSPVQVGALTDWKQVSIGSTSSFAIKTNGTLWAWGAGGEGRLGLNTVMNRSSPVQVGALTDWKQVSGFGVGAAAIKTDGTLWTWGFGGRGRLGLNNLVNRSSPVQVGSLTNWRLLSNNTNPYYCHAIKTDGTLWAWGGGFSSAYRGILGLNDAINRSSPVQVGTLTWYSIATGVSTVIARK